MNVAVPEPQLVVMPADVRSFILETDDGVWQYITAAAAAAAPPVLPLLLMDHHNNRCTSNSSSSSSSLSGCSDSGTNSDSNGGGAGPCGQHAPGLQSQVLLDALHGMQLAPPAPAAPPAALSAADPRQPGSPSPVINLLTAFNRAAGAGAAAPPLPSVTSASSSAPRPRPAAQPALPPRPRAAPAPPCLRALAPAEWEVLRSTQNPAEANLVLLRGYPCGDPAALLQALMWAGERMRTKDGRKRLQEWRDVVQQLSRAAAILLAGQDRLCDEALLYATRYGAPGCLEYGILVTDAIKFTPGALRQALALLLDNPALRMHCPGGVRALLYTAGPQSAVHALSCIVAHKRVDGAIGMLREVVAYLQRRHVVCSPAAATATAAGAGEAQQQPQPPASPAVHVDEQVLLDAATNHRSDFMDAILALPWSDEQVSRAHTLAGKACTRQRPVSKRLAGAQVHIDVVEDDADACDSGKRQRRRIW